VSDLQRLYRKYALIALASVGVIIFFIFAQASNRPPKKVEIPDTNSTRYVRDVLESPIPVLVDYWSDTCIPCKEMEPILQSIANRYEGRLKVVRVNMDVAKDVGRSYDVTAVPTLIFYKGGKERARIVSKTSEANLVQKIEPLLQ
jgi:thioredoxin 1